MFFSNSKNVTGPRDVFLHLLETLALYISAGSFIALIFGFINIYLPDVLEPHSIESIREGLRWPLAMLIVVYPFYLWITQFLQRDVADNPQKQKLKTRRWLLYLTPVLAVITIAGDLITLIYYFLEGGLTTPFVLKVLTVLIVAATLLTYYGWILRNEKPPQADARMRWFARGIAILGAAVIIGGLFVVGSPQQERERRFDQRRINDLQQIEFTLSRYFQENESLPSSLTTLASRSPQVQIPADPKTNTPYEYQKTGERSFKLCATFATGNTNKRESIQPPQITPRRIDWNHPAGRHCFDLSVEEK